MLTLFQLGYLVEELFSYDNVGSQDVQTLIDWENSLIDTELDEFFDGVISNTYN